MTKDEPLSTEREEEEELLDMKTSSSNGNDNTGHIEVLTEQPKKEELLKLDVDCVSDVPVLTLATAPVSGEIENKSSFEVTPSDGVESLDEQTPGECVIVDSISEKDES